MAGPTSRRSQQFRTQLAQTAARILLESGNRDYAAAKRKAAERLGMRDLRGLPSNLEIEQALEEYQRIFHADRQPDRLRHLREQALAAMQLLSGFRPRLVGAVLRGTADDYSPIHLHVFSDDIEAVGLFLMERGIPFQDSQRRIRRQNGDPDDAPMLRFVAGDDRVELTIFPLRDERHAPLSPVDGKPMQRADVAAVERLIEGGGSD